ncbi:transmembrane protein, putative, partial [Rhizoctonia solani AG-3 Rhs1AP]
MAEPALSPALADALHELEVALLHVFASKCLAIAGFCILCYDHSLTFYEEVEFIWKQKRSLVSTFFVLIRYVTPLVLIVDLYDKGGLTHYIPNAFCLGWYYGETVWNLCAFALIHGLVALRIAYKYQVEFGYTVAYNTLFHAIEHSRKKMNTPVLYVLYRDGIVYFLVICCCSIFNMMVWLLAPPTLVALSKYFVLAIIPTMGSRLVLNLRSSRREDIMPTDRTTADETAYEMHPSKGLLHKSSVDRLGTFSPNAGSGHRYLSAQERDHLPQIQPSTQYYKSHEGESRWNVV